METGPKPPKYPLNMAVQPPSIQPQPRLRVTTSSILAKLSLIAAILSGVTVAWSNRAFVSNATEILGFSPSSVSILGTGSMAPTFPIGEGNTPEERAREVVAELPTWRYPGGVSWNTWAVGQHELEHGDLVFVRDTRPSNVEGTNGLIKRVIGLPGDTIELRDGFVRRNGEDITEPYTLSGRSTFGGPKLAECEAITVPANSVFLLGDNRKRSDDSRFRLGFVPITDIMRYYPWDKQTETFGSKWRTNAENDKNLAGTVTFDANQFFQSINEMRQQAGLKPFIRSSALNQVAQSRATQWASTTPPATTSAALLAAASRAGYENPLLAEIPIPGSFTSQELIESVDEISAWQEILLRPDYSDIGLGTYLSTNDCPKQSIVIFLGGYVPAEYDPSMITSWQNSLARLQEVKPTWTKLEDPKGGLKESQEKDLERLLQIIDTRIERSSSLVRTMQRREWFTDEQKTWLEEDAGLAEEQLLLSQKINNG